MAIVQSNFVTGALANNVVGPFLSSQTAGNTNIVSLGWGNATETVTGVTDTLGNTYTPILTNQGSTNSLITYMCANILGGTNSVTAVFSGSGVAHAIIVAEYPGTLSLDGTAGAIGTSNTPSSGPITTTNASDVLVGPLWIRGSGWNGGVGASWARQQGGSGVVMGLQDMTPGSTGTFSATATMGSSQTWILQIIALQPGGASSAPTVTAQAASSIATTSAVLNGTITADGGSNSTVEGFNWGLTTGYGNVASSTGSFGTGAFNQPIMGLAPSTLYHYQAFATNATGTGTSSDATFTTNNTPVISTSNADATRLLSNLDGAMAEFYFPLAVLKRNKYKSYQDFAHKIGWDTRVDVAQVFFSTLP